MDWTGWLWWIVKEREKPKIVPRFLFLVYDSNGMVLPLIEPRNMD